jgi:hypothetical protein
MHGKFVILGFDVECKNANSDRKGNGKNLGSHSGDGTEYAT